MSVATLLATALDHELRERFDLCIGQQSCEEIVRAILARTAAIGQAYETSHPGLPQPPSSGRVTDGGCVAKSDASAVDFYSVPWTAFLDGAGEPPSKALVLLAPNRDIEKTL